MEKHKILKKYPRENTILSIVIPVHNEEDFISDVLYSIIKSSFEHLCSVEILIIDNQCDDNTIEIAKSLLIKNEVVYKIITNTSKNTSKGFNLGINASRGHYIMITGGHTNLGDGYIKYIFNLINGHIEWDCIGGKQNIIAETFSQKIIKSLLTTSFGVGNSKFRTSEKSCYVDTVGYGTYKKEVFEKYGLFDESFIRNQDLEFNLRIKKQGCKLLFDPNLVTYHHLAKKRTIIKNLKKYFNNGKWIGVKIFSDSSWSLRHLVPMIFTIVLSFFLLASFLNEMYLTIVMSIILLHFCFGLLSSIVKVRKLKLLLLMPLFYFLFHIVYGLGTLYGTIKND